MDPCDLTLAELHQAYRRRELSAVEVCRGYLDRIQRLDPTVGAYLTVAADEALAAAEAADRRLATNDAPALCGVPLAIKDVLCTAGLRTTCGSRILENFVPPYDATVISRLKEAGAVILGKVTMDEFAMGSSNENCALGVPKNPHDLQRICGGSSGGSAAAVAGRLCAGALGSDTGGSIRQPASHCGIVGLKPTYGRVSRYGLVAYASSLDQVGPMTRDVRDCALLLAAIAGHDPKDSTSMEEPVDDYLAGLERDLAGMTVGVPQEYMEEGLDPEVKAAVERGFAALEAAGATLRPVSLPHTPYAVAAYYIIAPAEASANLSRFDGVRYGYRAAGVDDLLDLYQRSRSQGFGAEVKRRIVIGTFALSSGYYDAYYKKASQVRTLIIDDFRQAFASCDLLASPVAPTPAWRLGEKSDDPLAMYLSDILTIPANLAGLPAMSVPCGVNNEGLPIGMQLQAPPFAEARLLAAGANLERHLALPRTKPLP